MKKITSILAIWIVWLSAFSQTEIILTDQYGQDFDGFGVSCKWVAQVILENISTEDKNILLNNLFSDEGANISILRNSINEVNPDGFDQWEQEFIEAALQRNQYLEIFATPWSPNLQYLHSNDNRYYFNATQTNMELYAQKFVDYLNNYSNYSININYISIQNEPDFPHDMMVPNWNDYPYCRWEDTSINNFIPVLRETLDQNGYDNVSIVVPEEMGWQHSSSTVELLENNGSLNVLDIIATHGYWDGGIGIIYPNNNNSLDDHRTEIKDLVNAKNKKIWMTEWSDRETTWDGQGTIEGHPEIFGIDNGLFWSERIWRDLTKGDVSAWFYWWIFNANWYGNPGADLANEGLVVRNINNQILYPKRFYTFSQFSRFIEKGCKRILLNNDIPNGVNALAFLNPTLNKIVMVFVNDNESNIQLNVDATDWYPVSNAANIYRTSGGTYNEDMAQLADININNNIELIAKSVTTVLIPVHEELTIASVQFDKLEYYQNEQALINISLTNNVTGANVSFSIDGGTPISCNEMGNGVYTKYFEVPNAQGTHNIKVFAIKTGQAPAYPYRTSIHILPEAPSTISTIVGENLYLNQPGKVIVNINSNETAEYYVGIWNEAGLWTPDWNWENDFTPFSPNIGSEVVTINSGENHLFVFDVVPTSTNQICQFWLYRKGWTGLFAPIDFKESELSCSNIYSNFNGSPTNIFVGQSVNFSDASTGSPTSWQWTFEGGVPSNSTSQNPVVYYNTAGTFNVTLTVSNGTNTATRNNQDYINVTNTTSGLVAYYPFTNGSANDLSGYGNNGSISGGLTPTTDRFGMANCAFDFDGSNDVITVPHSSSLSISSEITFAFWIKKSSTNLNESIIIGKREQNNYEIQMHLKIEPSGSGISFGYSGQNAPAPYYEGFYPSINTYNSINDGNWHFIVIEHIYGTTGNSKIYIDNQLIQSQYTGWYPQGFNYPAVIVNSPMYIGRQNSESAGWFKGILDDIRIYNRNLSEVEISALYGESMTSCTGTPIVTDNDGNIYNTVQIGNQCWMRENLNIGTRIDGSVNQNPNNGLVDKYCYNDLESNCNVYGGLYQWNEMMQGLTAPGVQGICPNDWHIPTDGEWCTVTTFIDPSVDCNSQNWSGTFIGQKMKSEIGWSGGGSGTNDFNFTALPGGYREAPQFLLLGFDAHFWTSTKQNLNFRRYFKFNENRIYRNNDSQDQWGFSVRCLKNTTNQMLIINSPNNGSENWSTGSVHQITWTDYFEEAVKIELLKNNISILIISNSTPSSGTFNWTIPFNLENGNDYKIKISSTLNGEINDVSDNNFSISAPSITVTLPLNGQSFNLGQTTSITWEYTIIENVKITLLKNGIYQYTIANSTPCDGIYNWNIPLDLIGSNDYSIKIISTTNANIFDISDGYFTLNSPYISFAIKVFLEGPFDQTMMNNYLRTGGWLPLHQLFNQPPWNYSGTEAVNYIPNDDIVEWILIELRETSGEPSTATTDKIKDRKAGFIKKDGSIVAIDGYSLIRFTYTPTQDIYIVLRHRNHLSIMSSTAVTLTNNVYIYDFTNSSSKAYGTDAQKQIVPGVWAMYAGDDNADGQINLTDKNAGWNAKAGQKGYKTSDYNLETNVDNIDKDDYWYFNNGKTTQVPSIGESCPGIGTINYEGQVYHTVQIGSKCWLKENLNLGTLVDGANDQTNNSIIEKYCYNDDEANCNNYGGLYQWNEAMQYTTQEGAQGICPEGWHIPDDLEIDSLFYFYWAIGNKLKSCRQVNSPLGGDCNTNNHPRWDANAINHGTDDFGFSGLPGGVRNVDGQFGQMGGCALWLFNWGWASWYGLFYNEAGFNYGDAYTQMGYSVRCIKD